MSTAASGVRTGPMLASCTGSVTTWGGYGPAIHASILSFGIAAGVQAGLNPLPWVGIAYLITAVLIPTVVLLGMETRGLDTGKDTPDGRRKSFVAGYLGAAGAVFASLALATGPGAGIVMPIIFCGAPVVNTGYSLYGKKIQDWSLRNKVLFFSGLIGLIFFVILVLNAKSAIIGTHGSGDKDIGWIWLAYTFGTVFSWGFYGPFLHAGTAKMEGKLPIAKSMRALRPVGLAYGVVALVVTAYLFAFEGGLVITSNGVIWSLVGGALGCAGALGISFGTYFGKGPVAVMPIVFGGAPFFNTVYTILIIYGKTGRLPTTEALLQLCGAVLVGICSVVLVLVFKPKPVPPTAKSTS